MLHVLRDFARDRSGSYLIISALTMPALVGMAALGTEVGYWMHQQQKMQDAADSAVFAAATYYGPNYTSSTGVSNAATSIAAAYGFAPSSVGNASTYSTSISVAEPPSDGPSKGQMGAVEVTIKKKYPRMLSALFGNTPVSVSARAVAKTKGGYGCVLALDGTASGSTTAQGTVTIALQSCSLYDDSSSQAAVNGGGGAAVSALSVGIVGNISGSGSFTTTEGIWTGQPATADPYSDVNVPSFSGCDHHGYNTKTHDTLYPGVYCNGLHFNGGTTAVLTDGTYIIDGGAFLVDGGATLSCNHCTIILTSSSGSGYPNVTINGGSTVTLGPPNSGTYSGLVFYADRKTPVGTKDNLDGGSGMTLQGAVYLPTAAVDWSGGNATGTVCTQLIGDTVNFSGNAALGVNCTGVGVRMWGTGARLAE